MLIKFPPSLSEYQERYLKSHIQDWCLANGVVFADPHRAGHATTVPVTLYPTPFSRSGFEAAINLQRAFNSLYHAVVRNPDWLVRELAHAAGRDDDFSLALIDIYRRTAPHRTQSLTGGLFRSDYIVDKARTSLEEGRQIKQVEFNTVSVSFGALATRVSELHRFHAETAKDTIHGEVPVSPSLTELARGLADMHKSYITDDHDTVILIIVQPGETNVVDQRLIEYELYNSYGIVCVRATLEQALRKTAITEENRLTFVPLGAEVSVVYYRAGYAPNDYPTDAEWQARERLERSHAIQVPSVLTQLAGSKKVQQLLTDPDVVAQLKPRLDESQLTAIRRTFVGMWPLDKSPLGEEGRRRAFAEPENYVLKPQREGGGNNVYREDIPQFLRGLGEESWGAYVLMELIEPPRISNKILRNNEVLSGRIVSELGIFGTVLWDMETGAELMNTEAGFLLRTKMQTSNEGGIAAGFGCLDAVLLPGRKRSDTVATTSSGGRDQERYANA